MSTSTSALINNMLGGQGDDGTTSPQQVTETAEIQPGGMEIVATKPKTAKKRKADAKPAKQEVTNKDMKMFLAMHDKPATPQNVKKLKTFTESQLAAEEKKAIEKILIGRFGGAICAQVNDYINKTTWPAA